MLCVNLSLSVTPLATQLLHRMSQNLVNGQYFSQVMEKGVLEVYFEAVSCLKVQEGQASSISAEWDDGTCRTVLYFMVKSTGGSYSDMVALYPKNNLNAQKTKDYFDVVLASLSEVGFSWVGAASQGRSPPACLGWSQTHWSATELRRSSWCPPEKRKPFKNSVFHQKNYITDIAVTPVILCQLSSDFLEVVNAQGRVMLPDIGVLWELSKVLLATAVIKH